MNGGKNRGYTIIEVMLYLAISGVMFLLAAAFINGKQAAAQFTEGVNELSSKLQTVAQEVSDGQYPENDTVGCTIDGSGKPSIDNAGSGQGTNKDCVYMGKIVHFEKGTDAGEYNIIPIAGNRLSISADPKDANPVTIPDLIETDRITQNVEVKPHGINAIKINGGSKESYGFAFLTLPALQPGGDAVANGAQEVRLYYINGLGPGDDRLESGTLPLNDGHLKPADEIDICFDEGGNRQAAIVIGSRNNTLSVRVDRTGVVTC